MNQVTTNPNYHPRIEASIKRVGKFLTFYKTPSQFYDPETGVPKEVEVKAWIKLMAETVNSRIDGQLEGDGFDVRLREIISNVATTYKGREWPQPHHLETAANIVAKKHQVETKTAHRFNADRFQHAADQIKADQPVDPCFVVPPYSTELMQNHGVNQGQIERYQRSAFHNLIEVYGSEVGAEAWHSFIEGRKLFIPKEDEPQENQSEKRDAIRQAMQRFSPA